jgi:hypothetical protein
MLQRVVYSFASILTFAKVTITPPAQHNGAYYPEYFVGYCKGSGGYQSMDDLADDFDMKQVYGF